MTDPTVTAASAGETTDDCPLSPEQVADFERDGFLIVRGLADGDLVQQMREVTWEGLAREIEPIEFEADVHYPGSPTDQSAEGGRTVRRLKQAISRDPVFTRWVSDPGLVAALSRFLKPPVVMPMAHHNCIMTKNPRHSSETGWHRDIRYWSYEQPDLVSVWLALTEETPDNGSLKLLPSSHREVFDHDRFDEELFWNPEHPENRKLLERTVSVQLDPGDAVFFHCQTLHAADRNTTDDPKLSVVFTFRGSDNPPRPGSRSASMPEMILPRGS